MPLPTPNLYPAFNIIRLSHVELAVTDLAKSVPSMSIRSVSR
jgi:catechol 2,3-dioxygenase